jgi:magnesium chelatase family protein
MPDPSTTRPSSRPVESQATGQRVLALDDAGRSVLRAAMTQLGMSARAFHRILKLARTIADLEDASDIQTHHLAEAIQYRPRRQL